MKWKLSRLAAGLGILSLMFGCGSGSNSSSSNNSPSPTGNVNTMVSDAPTEDWATVGVRVLSISLTPQSGGTPVTIYTAPGAAPWVNLVQLDQVCELLGNLSVTPGTYTSATLTISANPGDVILTASADPEAGFPVAAGATVSSSQIQIMGATGAAGSQTVSLNVSLVSPLTVAANATSALDLEFDLSNPTLIIPHVTSGGTTLFAIDFNGPVIHHPIADVTRLVLRDLYAQVNSIGGTGNSSITVTKDFPTEPATTPETPIASSQTLSISADTDNGTIFYDLDAGTVSTITSFSAMTSSLPGRYVRVAARFQGAGSLIAVRIWASNSFNRVWLDPEGHVLNVNTTTNTLTIQGENGGSIPLTINSSTQFFIRTPYTGSLDAQAVSTGTAFLSNLVRGFKVHAMAVNPSTNPIVAQTVDIEIARFDGQITSSSTGNFVDERAFNTAADNYSQTLPYIAANTPNGNDPVSGAAIVGFKFWDFTFPTQVDSGTSAITQFVAATNGLSNFGGSTTAVKPWGVSFATWNDPNNPNGWAAPWDVLLPTPIPLGTVSATWTSSANGGSFTMTVPGGSSAVAIDVSDAPGAATLVYEVNRTSGIITITPQILTTASGLSNTEAALAGGTVVKVFGVPQSGGAIQAYVLFYFSGTVPTS